MQSRILIAEDSATQAEALRALLEDKQYVVAVARSGEEALQRLDSAEFDLVLSDVVMPGIDGYELCRHIKSNGRPDLPVILLTTLGDPVSIVRGMECGADNYIMKPWEPQLLLARVSHALYTRTLHPRSGRSSARAAMGVRLAFLGSEFTITAEKEQILEIFLSSLEDIIRSNGALEQSQRALAEAHAQLEAHAKDMSVQARVSTEKYWALMRHARDMIFVLDTTGRVVEANERATELLGVPIGVVRGQPLEDYVAPEAREDFRDRLATLAAVGRVEATDLNLTGAGGRRIACDFSASLAPGETGDLALAIVHDLTERRRLEEHLRQSQKMEAVGRLAGGIAHDFNNLLTAIRGFSDLVLASMAADDPCRPDVGEICGAADRAAALTRQLLTFSRKQVLEPTILDVNETARSFEKMMARVLGEDISLVTKLEPNIGLVKADPGQLDQVLMNLAVNARDAMPNGGTLTIETADFHLDADEARRYGGVAPGRYIMLAVTDTGVGMDAETQARIFEPFFTTKDQGKGTGLGLSTVYGIVQQSGGHVAVRSEPGRGTTFKVYLPRAASDAQARSTADRPAATPGSGETILLVEDEAAVRNVTARVLTRAGYRVLEAPSPREAVAMCERHHGPIHLIMTDMVMPEMSGPEIAARLVAIRPSTPVLFISGYIDDAVTRRGLVGPGTNFLSKPFTSDSVTRKVREVLDQAAQ